MMNKKQFSTSGATSFLEFFEGKGGVGKSICIARLVDLLKIRKNRRQGTEAPYHRIAMNRKRRKRTQKKGK